MSFLAQLRQQQPLSQSGMRLSYWLSWEGSRLSLALRVAEMHGREVRGTLRSYQLRRDHLRTPPAFIRPQDLPQLSALLAADEQWLDSSEGDWLPENLGDFLQALSALDTAFIWLSEDEWIPLSLGSGISIEPCWRVDGKGYQHPGWGNNLELPVRWAGFAGVVFIPEAGQVRVGQHSFTRAAFDLWQKCAPLAPSAIASFLTEHGSRWQDFGLPLPRKLPECNSLVQLEPLLLCRSVANAFPGSSAYDHIRHELQLMVRASDDYWCVTCDSAGKTDYCWDGEYLHKVAVPSEWIAAQQQGLTPWLDGFTQGGDHQWYAGQAAPWQALLLEHRESLEAQGFVFQIEPGFHFHFVEADHWQVHSARSDANRWQLQVTFTADEQHFELFDLLHELQLFNSEYLRGANQLTLPDGRTLLLPKNLLGELLQDLGDWVALGGPSGKVPINQSYRLHELRSALPEQTEWHDPDQLLERADRLRTSPLMQGVDIGVKAQLRSYQWLGVCWLQHLHDQGLNGLLADDMGLGKTLQTLAHLSNQQRQGALDAPALIVAPTSLLSNWAAEAQRFCPHLSCLVMHGGQRQKHWAQVPDYHLIITSYHCLARDVDQWQEQALSWLVLDEAQVIKNPRAQLTQAVRSLECERKLALSGTPLANHLGELWSVLDFLNPKVLGNLQQFRSYYQKPIEQAGDNARLQQLLKRIAPLILRRTKNEVARDLPPKTEVQQTLLLGDKQRAFYQDLKERSWQSLQDQLEGTDSEGQKHLLVLTALLKLRQACCDPELLGAADIPSAKREHCVEMVEELVAEERSILIFSQFTSVLDILARELDRKGIGYFQLTGQTQNRAELVADFQSGQAPVFLISLKAGGVGLNLTRADTVIHYDPWWNVAAEQQASDRAHRIGQDKPVFVYKLIAQDTIEEKIALLQQAKAGLSQQIDQQAQASGQAFALRLEELLGLWQENSGAKKAHNNHD